MTAFAFQCQDCDALEVGEAAGERAVPVNCRHCDIGSHLEWRDAYGFRVEDGTPDAIPVQIIDRPNRFTVLADLSPEEQAAVLRDRADPGDTIVRYVPALPPAAQE